jgi:hypothetical protein
MLWTCGSTSAEVNEVRSCASTVAVKDVCTYNVVAVFKEVCDYVSTANVKDVFV